MKQSAQDLREHKNEFMDCLKSCLTLQHVDLLTDILAFMGGIEQNQMIL